MKLRRGYGRDTGIRDCGQSYREAVKQGMGDIDHIPFFKSISYRSSCSPYSLLLFLPVSLF